IDPAINRIYEIMSRAGFLRDAPDSIADADLEIQYVSILSVAQRAVGVVPTERLLAMIGQISALQPSAIDLIDWDTTIRDYGSSVGVQAKTFRDREEVAQTRGQRPEQLQAQERANVGSTPADGPQTHSEADAGREAIEC